MLYTVVRPPLHPRVPASARAPAAVPAPAGPPLGLQVVLLLIQDIHPFSSSSTAPLLVLHLSVLPRSSRPRSPRRQPPPPPPPPPPAPAVSADGPETEALSYIQMVPLFLVVAPVRRPLLCSDKTYDVISDKEEEADADDAGEVVGRARTTRKGSGGRDEDKAGGAGGGAGAAAATARVVYEEEREDGYKKEEEQGRGGGGRRRRRGDGDRRRGRQRKLEEEGGGEGKRVGWDDDHKKVA